MSRIWTPEPEHKPEAEGIDLGEEFDAIDCAHFIDEYINLDNREIKTISNRAISWSTSPRGRLKGYDGPRYSRINYQAFEVPKIREYIRMRLSLMVCLSLANDLKGE